MRPRLPGEDASVADFVADLDARFRGDGDGKGVQILTYHRAKGQEFEAVFLPFLQEGELPARQAKRDESIAEERRLLYVGLTRAKRSLMLSWSMERKPSRFLEELGARSAGAKPAKAANAALPDDPVFGSLRVWRLERATADEVPAFVVFGNKTLAEIASRRPATLEELAAVPGVGPAKLERYGADVLAVLGSL